MRAERVALMPDWPARMDCDMAALYLGIGVTSFREKVKSKEYPQPVQEGGRLLWSRAQLDQFVGIQFGLSAPSGTWDDL